MLTSEFSFSKESFIKLIESVSEPISSLKAFNCLFMALLKSSMHSFMLRISSLIMSRKSEREQVNVSSELAGDIPERQLVRRFSFSTAHNNVSVAIVVDGR